MEIPYYAKIKPYWFKFIPGLSKPVANTIYPYIFLPKEIHDNLISDKPNQLYRALLIHEEVHYERQRRTGQFVWGLKYLFSSKFRLNEELIAVKDAIKYLKSNNILVQIENLNYLDPNYLFLWPISKYYTIERVKNLFRKTTV